MPSDLRRLEYATEKWGGHGHYRGWVLHLGDDEFGSWFWGPAGRTMFRGNEPWIVTEQDALILVKPGAWWAPSWWIGHPETDLYVNIQTPAEWTPERVVAVDLDLDVVRFTDGRTEVVDRDEFELHRERYGYPPELVERAEEATATALDLVVRRVPPFDGAAAAEWIARARG